MPGGEAAVRWRWRVHRAPRQRGGTIGLRPAFRQEVGIHRVGTTARRIDRQLVARRKLGGVRIGARQKTRDLAFLAIDFLNHPARIRRHLLAQIELVVRRAHERLGEIHRVGDDRHHRQDVAIADPVLGERRLVAARQSVAPQIPFLQMRDGDGEHVAVPLRGRESGPRVQRVCRRMRTAIEIDRTVHRPQPLGVKRGDLTRDRIDLFGDAQVRRPAPDVIGRVRTTLPLGKRLNRGVPGIGAHDAPLR